MLKVPGEIAIRTHEGQKAFQEAIDYINSHGPVGALEWSPGLAKVAKSHVDDAGAKGIRGHESSDGTKMAKRMEKFGR